MFQLVKFWLFIIFVSATYGLQMEVREGESATFNCADFNTSASSVDFVFVKFRALGADETTLSHVAFIHRTAFDREDVNAESPFEDRMKLSSDGDLTIINTTTSDGGLFECSAYSQTFTLFSKNTLQLSVKPLGHEEHAAPSGANVGLIIGIILALMLLFFFIFLILLKRTNLVEKARTRITQTYRSMKVGSQPSKTQVAANP